MRSLSELTSRLALISPFHPTLLTNKLFSQIISDPFSQIISDPFSQIISDIVRGLDLLAPSLLQAAHAATQCQATGTEFSASTWRYRCSCSGSFYSKGATVYERVIARVDSNLLKPVRYGKAWKQKIDDAERALVAITSNPNLTKEDIGALENAVQVAKVSRMS